MLQHSITETSFKESHEIKNQMNFKRHKNAIYLRLAKTEIKERKSRDHKKVFLSTYLLFIHKEELKDLSIEWYRVIWCGH